MADNPLLTIQTYAGHNINDYTGSTGTYATIIEGDGQALSVFPSQAVLTDRPGAFPGYIRTQPTDRVITLLIAIPNFTQTNFETLASWFDPLNGTQWLAAVDDAGKHRQISCVAESFTWVAPAQWKVALRCPTGVWEATDADEQSLGPFAINDSGDTFTITGNGDTRAYPKFDIIAQGVAISASDGWNKRRRVVIVNRSELPLYDPVGDGYPILLCDLSTLSITPGNDVRVLLNGVDQPRWIDGNNLWVLLQFRPRKTFVLADAITSTSAIGDLTVSNADGLAGWPASGFFLIDTEAFQYDSITDTTIHVTHRGALGTTAATHGLGATSYWVEHPYLDLIYGYTFASNPSAPDDLKPVIDLSSSDNNHWVWPSTPYLNANDRRAAAWRLDYSDDNPNTQYTRAFEEAGDLVFENNPPAASKVLANNAFMEVPCALSKAIAAVTVTRATSGTVPVEGYGYRKKVIRTDYTYDVFDTGEQYTYTVTNLQYTLGPQSFQASKKEVQQTGQSDTVIDNEFPVAQGPDSQTTSYESIDTGNYANTTVNLPYSSSYNVPTTKQPSPASTYRTTYTQEKGVIANDAMTEVINGVDSQGYEGALSVGAAMSQDIFRVRLGALIPIGVDLTGVPLTDVPGDISTGTGARISYSAITLQFDQGRTPTIVISAELDLYLLNGTLTNNTTGDYLDFGIPGALNMSITVDPENREVIDNETGDLIPWGIFASNPLDWLYVAKGANTFEFVQSGIAAGAGALHVDNVTMRDRWL